MDHGRYDATGDHPGGRRRGGPPQGRPLQAPGRQAGAHPARPPPRPDLVAKVSLSWMENIADVWISRQLWWGHRIPIYYCDAPGCQKRWAAIEEPTRCPDCDSASFRQDEDVLDTWFSSGLWPFSTLG